VSAVLAFAHVTTQNEVELAWATYRALIIAEVDDKSLLDDEIHQRALTIAKDRFQRLYEDWSRN
jgi:hypothetical protein